jgi:signal transduction histidine kinase
LVWEILREFPRSPISSLGFKICRQTGNLPESNRLRAFLEARQVFNDQAKLDWVMVQLALGDPNIAHLEIQELTSSEKSIAFRLHVAKTLAAKGYGLTGQESDPQVRALAPDGRLVGKTLVIPSSVAPELITGGVIPEDRVSTTDFELDEFGGASTNEVATLVEYARAFGEARDLDGLKRLYLQCREQRLVGQREHFMTVVLKSTSVIATDLGDGMATRADRLECVKFAELVFGDLLACRYRLLGQQFAPMIATHLAAELPRSAHKYLIWSMRSDEISFQFQLWPFMRYFQRRRDIDGLYAFYVDCERAGFAPDLHAVGLICRELNRANRANLSWEILERSQSAFTEVDSHVLMVQLETLAALDRGHEMLSCLKNIIPKFIPDARAFGFVVDYLYFRNQIRETIEVLEFSQQLGVHDSYLELRLSLSRAQLGDWDLLRSLLAQAPTLKIKPHCWLDVFELLKNHKKAELYSVLCDQIRVLAVLNGEIWVLDFCRTIEKHFIEQMFSDDVRFGNPIMELFRELVPGTALIAVADDLAALGDPNRRSDELDTLESSRISQVADLPIETLNDIFVAACAARKIDPALLLLKVLIQRGAANSWHLGTILNDFVRTLPPERLEEICSDYKLKVGTLNEHSHRILFNLLAKAYRHAGRRVDVERLIAEMRSLGIQEDDFTLRERLEISAVKPSSVGVALTAKGSLDFEALRRVLDDLRHELSHFVAQLSLRLQAVGDVVNESKHPGVVAGVREVLELTRNFSQRIEGYGEIANPNTSGLCEISATVKDVIARYREIAESRGVVLVESSSGREYWVAINEYSLQTVLQNLLDNALKELERCAVESPRIRVAILAPYYHRVNDLVSISVQDNGHGVPEEMAEQIFTRGFTTRPGHGFGLGLALVRSIVESADGTIQLVRDGQPGAHFLIQLRLGEAPND